MDRREALRLGLAPIASAFAEPAFPIPKQGKAIPVPRANDGINVQPVRRFNADAGSTPPLINPCIVDAQMRALYELGFAQMRITISFERFGPNFVAAIPYVRAARALGIDVLGIITQFSGFDLVQAIGNRRERDEVLETYVRIFADDIPVASQDVDRFGTFDLQVLNEPTEFLGIRPEDYVREFLRPAYLHLKEDDPRLNIVSAAPVGSVEGVLRLRAMLDAGAELFCDRIAFHVYSERLAPALVGLTQKPIWITESGARSSASHLRWMTSTFERLRREIPGVERIFWFDLFDFEANGFRLIELNPDEFGGCSTRFESPATINWLKARVDEAAAGQELIPYDTLVPEIELYFPTDEDFRLLRSTFYGADTWG